MAALRVSGLAPYLPPGRPRDPARWWVARGVLEGDRLLIRALGEEGDPPAPDGPTGLAAPCTLPGEFLRHFRMTGSREEVLGALAGMTRSRLFSRVRGFASRRTRGHRHPVRASGESLRALDRRRLALFHAALPLLQRHPTLPWSAALDSYLFEVDPPAFLGALQLPGTGLAGDRPEAVRCRATALAALEEGVLGICATVGERDLAVASHAALRAVIAAVAAAWIAFDTVRPQADDTEAWIPLPRRT
jgi:hypothetical protein